MHAMNDNQDLTPRFENTRHFEDRRSTRGLPAEWVDFVLLYGDEFDACDARSYTVVNRHLPRDLRGSEAARKTQGWIVVVSPEGTLLTCYRRRDAAHYLKTKQERRFSWCVRSAA